LYSFLSVLFAKVQDRRIILKTASFSYLPVVLLYVPWISTVRRLASTSDFWIEKPSADFILQYFKLYFGNETFVTIIILFLMAVYFIANTRQPHFIEHRLLLLTWLIVVYLTPYIQSHIFMPILYPRFTIVALPAIVLMASRGLEDLRSEKLKYLVLGSLLITLCVNVFFTENRFYSRVIKEQWREASLYILERDSGGKYPISAHHFINYYFNVLYKSDRKIYAPIESLERAEIVLNHVSKGGIPGFWLIQAHKPMKKDIKQFLEKSFRVGNKNEFLGIQIFLYLPKEIIEE
jgi:hypothetical protein